MVSRTARTRLRLRMIHGDFCHWCGGRMIFEVAFQNHDLFATVEHVIERRNGGTWEWENLRLAHRSCNMLRSNPEQAKSRKPRQAHAVLPRQRHRRDGG